MRFRALLLLAIAAGIHAGPIAHDESTCSTTCVPSGKFGYERGNTYRFQYEADTVTSLNGAADDQSAIRIRSSAEVTVLSECEMVLMLGDSKLEESDPSDISIRQTSPNSGDLSAALERNGLRFSFQDGRVESVCASEDEPVWVVNFKRGILSAFQNSMSNFDEADATVPETDVSGNCDASYEISGRDYKGITVTKTKNLLACTDRTNFFTSLQATPYMAPSDIQSLPLLTSTHQCTQEISKDGILSSSVCSESHMFRPFSHHDNGAVTTVRQSLLYQGQSAASRRLATGTVTERKSLVFEHELRSNSKSNDPSEVAAILEEICASTDIRPDTPRLFAKLVYAMRQLDVVTLIKTHNKVERGVFCRNNLNIAKKFFHDAIPTLGTEGSVAMIAELTNNGEITGPEADIWITSLAFVQEPTAPMITQAKTLLTSNNPTVYLAVSSLVHSFCQSADCSNNADVQQITSSLAQNLGYNCKVSKDEEHKVLMSLKALGNAGITGTPVSTLARCASNDDVPTTIRLAAIEAYRRLPCQQDREGLMSLLMNTNDDSELRIAAYLAVMQCPDISTFTQVKHVLETEEVNQVGSFIWSHLTNLMETSDPFKKDIRAIIEDEHLVKEFNMDARKFSRNYEGSFFLDSINTGAKYESNVIFSPSSFLPRSAMLNLTVAMFGKSVNLVEIGGRMEAMEQYLEKFFGPHGYFPQNTVTDLIKNKLESVDNELRGKMLKSDPTFSLYMKMFGNELGYVDMDSIKEMDVENWNFLDVLIKLAQKNEAEVTRSYQFLDTEMQIPTTIGLPLCLSVNGTATVNIQMAGKMDIRRLGTWPSSFDINGSVKPSGAVALSTVMGVDAFVSRTGLRMLTTLHSSTEMSGKVTVQDSKILEASINSPRDRVEILSVQKKFFIFHRDSEIEQTMGGDSTDKSMCTGEMFATVTGIKVCGDLSYTNTHNVMTSPVSAALYLEAADTHTSYDIEARVEKKKERRDGKQAISNVGLFSFNTPGSRVNREFSVEYTLDRAATKLSANLKTPWTEGSVEGSLTNTNTLKNANIQMTVNRQWKYAAVAELAIDTKGNTKIFTPRLAIDAPGMDTKEIVGKAKITPLEKCDVQLSVNNIFTAPVILSGVIEKTSDKKYEMDITLSSPVFNTRVTGFTVVKDGAISTRTEFKYDYNHGSQHKFVLNGKLKDQCTNYATKYSINTAIQTTEFPDYNAHFQGSYLLNRKQLETTFDLKYGADTEDMNRRIVFTQALNYEGDMRALTFDHTMTAMWKAVGLNMNSKLSHSHTLHRDISTEALLTYAPGKDINLDIKGNMDSRSPLVVSGDIKLGIPGREMRFYQSMSESNEGSPRQYTHEGIVQWQSGKQIRATTTYKISEADHEMKTEITSPRGVVTVIDGSVTLNWEAFKSMVTVEHGGRSYSTGVQYNYLFRPNKIQVGGKYDLIVPGRHIVVESDVSSIRGDHEVNFKTQWDADNDQSKKVSVSGLLQLDGDDHTGQAKVNYPGRQMTLTLKQKLSTNHIEHHSELSWTARKTIVIDVNARKDLVSAEGLVKVSTPFTHDITVQANARKPEDKLTAHVEVDYGTVVSADISMTKPTIGYDTMETSLTVNTPYRGFETLNVAHSHNLNKGSRSIHVEVARNSDKAEITGQMKRINGKSQGLAELVYPGRKINFAYSCMKTDSNLEHHSEFSWSDNEKISFDVKGLLTTTNADLGVKLSTPFNSNDLTLDIKAERDRDVIKANIVLDYGRRISSDVNLRYSPDLKFMENSVVINTPFRGWEKLSLKTSHDIDSESKNAHFEVAVNDETVQVTAKGQCNGVNSMAEIELKTPYTDVIGLKLSKTLDDNKLVSHLEAMWGQGKKIELDINGQFADDKLGGTIELKTPYSHPMALRSTAENNVAHLEAEWQDKKVEIDAKGRVEDNLMEASIELKTPYTELMALHANIGNNVAHIEAEWQNKKVELDGKFEMKENNIEGSIELKTPYTQPIAVRSSASLQNGEGIAHAEVEWQRKKMELDVKGKYQGSNVEGSVEIKTPYTQPIKVSGSATISANQLTSVTQFEWENGKKIEIELSGKNVHDYTTRDLEAKASLKTPYTEDITIEATHKDNGNAYNSNMMVQWAPRKQITVAMTMNHNVNGMHFSNDGKLTINTPFSELQSAAVSWDQQFQGWNNIKSHNQVEYNGQTAVVNLDHGFEMTSYSHKLKTEASIQTPFSELTSANAAIGYVWNRRKLQGSATVSHNEVNYMTTSVDSSLGDDIRGEARFQSKIPHAEDMSMTYTVRTADSLGGLVELKWTPTQAITLQYDFTRKEKGISVSGRLTTPFTRAQTIACSFDHFMEDGVYQTKAEIEYAPNKKITLANTLQMERGFADSFEISAPCPYFRSLKSSFSIAGEDSDFNHKSALTFEMDNVEVAYTGQLDVRGARYINGFAQLTTPFRHIRNHKINIDHKLVESEYISKLSYDYNRQTVNVETHFENSENKFTISSNVKTTFDAMSSLNFAFEHDKSRYNEISGKGLFELKVFGDKCDLTATYTKVASQISGDLKTDGFLDLFVEFGGPVSVSFSHDNPSDQCNTHAEIKVGDKKIILHNHINVENGLKIDSYIRTPVKQFRTVAVNIDHTGRDVNFDTKAKFLMGFEDGDFELDTALAMDSFRLFKGHATLKTPIRNAEMFSLVIQHELSGPMRSIEQAVSVEYPNNNKISLTRSLKTNADGSGVSKTMFTSPFSGFEEIVLDTTLRGDNTQKIVTMTLTYAPRKAIEVEIMTDYSESQLSIKIDTPFTQMSHFYVEGTVPRPSDHWSDLHTQFKAELTMNNNHRTVTGRMNFSFTQPVINLGLNLETNIRDFEVIRIDLKHNNNPNNNFVTTVDVNIPSKKMSFASNLNFPSFTNFSGRISFEGPIDMSLSFNHEGDYRNFDHTVEFMSGNKKTEYEGHFQAILPIKGSFKLTSPFKFMRNQQVEFSVHGTPTDLTANAELTCNNKKITANGAFKLDSGLQASVEVTTPFSKDVKLVIDHQGMYNFDHKTVASYGKKTIELTGNFKTSPEIEGQIQLSTPFTEVQSVVIKLKNTGNLGDSSTEFNFNHNNKNSLDIKLSFDLARKSANLEIESSFGRKFSVEIAQNIDLPNFIANGKVIFGTKSIALDTVFDTNPVKGHFRLNTPWEAVQNIDAAFNLDRPQNNYEGKATFSYNRGPEYAASATLVNSDKLLQGSFEITTPHECMREVTAEFTHKFTRNILQCHAKMAVNDKSIMGDVDFKLNPEIEGTVHVQTPFTHMEDLMLTVEHLDLAKTSLKISHNEYGTVQIDSKLDLDIKMTGKYKIIAELTIQTPSDYMKKGSIKFNLENYSEELVVFAEVEHNMMGGKVELNGKLSSYPIEAEFTLKTPFADMRETSLMVKHDGSLTAFESSAEFNHNKLGRATFSGDFRPWTGNFLISSDCPYMKNVQVSFAHTGDFEHFTTMTEVNYHGKTIKSSVEFETNPIKAAFKLEIPSGKSFGAEIGHQGDLHNFQTNIVATIDRNRMLTAEMKMDTRNGLDTVVKVNSPVTSEIEMIYNHHGDIEQFTCHSEMKVNSKKVVNGDLSFKLEPLEISIDVKTPYKSLKHLEIGTTLTGSIDNFKTVVDVTYNDVNRYHLATALKVAPTEISIDLETPISWIKSLQATATFDGKLSDFKSSLDINHNDVNKYHTATALKVSPEEINLDLETPLTWLESLQVTATVAGERRRNNFRGGAEVTHNRRNKYQVQTAFKMTDESVNFELKTPLSFLKNFKLAAELTGELTDFKSSVEVTYNNAETQKFALSFKADHSESDYKFNCEIQTPMARLRTLTLSGEVEGQLQNFETKLDAVHNGGKPKHAELIFRLTSKKINVVIQTPFKQVQSLQMAGSLVGEINDFKANMDITHNNGKTYVFECVHKLTPTELETVVKTPFPMLKHVQATGSFSGEPTDFTANLDVTYNKGKTYSHTIAVKLDENEVSLNLQTPHPMLKHVEAAAKFNGEINDFRASLDVEYNSLENQHVELAFKMTRRDLNIEIQTPLADFKHVEIIGAVEGDLYDFEASCSVAYNHGRKYEGELSLKLTENELELDLKTPARGMKHLEVEATYSGSWDNFNANLGVTHNDGGKHAIDLSLNQQNLIEFRLHLATPHSMVKHLQVDFSYTGSLRDFSTSLSFTYNDNAKKTVDLKYKQMRTGINLELATPLPPLRTLEFEVTFDGTINDFTSNIAYTLNNDDEQTIALNFKLMETEVTAGVRSSIDWMRQVQITGTHTGTYKDFTTSLELTFNNNKIANAVVAFKLLPLEASLNVESPWRKVRDLSVSVSHSYDSSAIKSNAELTLNTRQVFAVDSELTFDPLGGTVTIESPYLLISNVDKITASFSHQGTLRAFQNKAEVTFGEDKKFTIDNNFSFQEIRSVITTPIRQYSNLGLHITKKGNFRTAFETHSELTYKDGKTIELETSFKNYKRLSADVSFKSPFTKDARATLKHQYNDGVLSTEAGVNYGRKQLAEISLDLKIGLESSGNVHITTPISEYEDITADFTHTIGYTEDSLTASSNVNYQGREIVSYSASGQYTDLTNMGMKVEVKTPFTNAEYFMASGKVEGTIKSLVSEVEIILPREYSIEGNFKLQTAQSIKATLETNVKGFEDISVDINHIFNAKQLKIDGAVTYASTKLLSFNLDLKRESQVYDATVTLTSVYKNFESLATEAHFEGRWDNFKSNGFVSWADGQQISVNGALNSEDGIPKIAKFTVNAPGDNTVTIDFNNEVSTGSLESSLVIGWGNDQAIDIRVQGSMSGNIQNVIFTAKAEMTTPFNLLSHGSIEAKHEHTWPQSLVSTVDIQINSNSVAGSEISLNPNSGAVEIKGPWKVSMDYNRDENGGSLNMRKPIEIEASYTLTDNSVSVDVKKPFVLDAAVTFTSNTGSLVMQRPLKVDARYEIGEDSVSVNMVAPYPVVGTVTYSRRSVEVSMVKPIKVEARVTRRADSVSVFVTKPIKVDATATYTGESASFEMKKPIKIDATATYNGEKVTFNMQKPRPIQFEGSLIGNTVTFNMQQPMTIDALVTYSAEHVSLKMDNPINIDAEARCNGQSASFKMEEPIQVDAVATYNAQSASFNMNKPIVVDAAVTMTANGGSFVMQKPYPIDTSFEYDVTSGASWEMRRPIRADAKFTYTQNGGSFTMTNPYPVDMSISLEQNGASFEMKTPITMDASYTFTGETGSFVMREPYPVDARFTITEGSGSFEMQSPYPVETSYHYNDNGGSFVMESPFKVDANLELTANSGSFTMRNPVPVDAKLDIQANGMSFVMTDPYDIDFAYTFSRNGASVKMDSPYKLDAAYTIRDNGHTIRMRNPYQLNARYAVSGNAGYVNMDGPYPVDASYDINADRGSVKIQQPYPVDAEYVFGKTEGRFAIQNPITIELTYSLGIKNGKVEVTKPIQMAVTYEVEGTGINDISGNVGLTWEAKRGGDKNVRVEFLHKDESTRYMVKRTGSLKAILPTRTISMSGSEEKSGLRWMESGELMWDQAKNRKMSYVIDANRRPGYSADSYNLLAKLETPIRSLELAGQHTDRQSEYTSEATMQWDSNRDRTKAVTLRSQYTHSPTVAKSEIVLSSPLLTHEIKARNEFTMMDDSVIYSCLHELVYSDDPREILSLTTRFADDGNTYRGNHNYTAAVVLMHPSSTIGMKMKSYVALTDVVTGGGASVDYTMVSGEMMNANLRAEINKIRKTMLIAVDTPVKTASIKGEMTNTNNGFKYTLVAGDETSQIDTVLDVKTSDRTFNMEAHLNPRNPTETISFKGSYISPTELKVQALHGNGGDMTTDSEISIDMDDSNLLKTRMHWRPAVWTDIKSALVEMVNNMDTRTYVQTMRSLRQARRAELKGKVDAIYASLPSMGPIVEFVTSEAESYGADMKVVRKEIKRMYYSNEFYMQTIDKALEAAVTVTKKVLAKISEITHVIYPYISATVDKTINFVSLVLREWIDQLIYTVEVYGPIVKEKAIAMMYTTLTTTGQVIKYSAETLLSLTIDVMAISVDYFSAVFNFMQPIIDAYTWAAEWCREICDVVIDQFDAVMETYPFKQLDMIANNLQSTVRTVASYMSEVDLAGPVYNAHLALAGNIDHMTRTMSDHADGISERYASVIYTVHRVVGANVEDYIHRPASEYVRTWLYNLRDQVKSIYEYLDIEDFAKKILDDTMVYVINTVKSNALYIVNDYLHLDLTKVVVYDPANGQFDLQLYIPNELPSLQYVPFTTIEWSDLWNRIKHVREELDAMNAIPDDANPWDYYYMYKPSPNPADWVPPFTAIATIAGQHITTFDNKMYEFLGTCSYIMAHDVIGKHFTIVKDYDKKMYRISVDSKQITVNMEGMITIDGTQTEIPVELESTDITRSGDVITINSQRGFIINIDLNNDLFTLELSGWFQNKVAGLLGTYTNEHADDFTMDNGQRTDNIDEMAESWKVGQCQNVNKADEYIFDESRRSAKVCKAIFGSRFSPLRNCFKVIDPKPYMSACMNDMEQTSEDSGVCKTAAAYAFKCKKSHIPVRLPKPCRKCQDQIANSDPKSADVIFVIEQKQCNNDMVSRIDNIAAMTDASLIDRDLVRNRFGLIGFGGRGVHNAPHSHTLGGKIMGVSEDMKLAAESLVFVEDGENDDSISALDMAIKYPFRAGVAKVVVLITCGPCQEHSISLSHVEQEMKAAGIQLHVLVEHEFKTSSPDQSLPRTSYVFGIDSDAAFTKSDARTQVIVGDSDLAQQIAPPSDKCANLALSTKGSFFNLQKLKEGRVRQQKIFMDVFARRVAKSAQSEECSICECNDEGVSTCRPCQNEVLLGRPDEEPQQLFNQELNDYLGTL